MIPGQHRPQSVAPRVRARLIVVAVALLGGFLLLIGRSVQIQFFQRRCWANLAKRQVWRNIRLEARRGEIYDRNGQELAVSIRQNSLAANCRLLKDPETAARKLAPVIEVPVETLLASLRHRRTFVWLKHYLTPRQCEAVRALDLEGIHFVRETRRYYPNVELAGQVLGFVGRDNHGLEGLELSQDSLLCGNAGTLAGVRDARGRLIYSRGLPADATPEGYSLRLTLDKRIQYIAEKALRRAVTTYEAKNGMALVVGPKTGEILAMAVFPLFNPNGFSNYRPSIWRNRTVTDAFEPGSTFKIFLAAAALEEGLAQPDDLFYCEQGDYRILNHTIHDLRKFGWLTLAQILRFSSNIGAVKVGEKLGSSRFYHYIRAFGFGSPTGIGLPGETAGLIRPPQEWSAVDLAAASFGQSLSVSAIQLAMALAAVANDGLLMHPLLIKEVLNPQGQVIRRARPQVVRRVISLATARRLKQLLADVLTPGGTGARAALARYRAAGKTGTAQKSSRQRGGYAAERYTASFVGFAPLAEPRIVVVVVINEPRKGLYGGVVAAPAFRQIASQTLQCLQVPPARGKNLAALENLERGGAEALLALQLAAYLRSPVDPAGLMPDLTGLSLRAALDRLGHFHGPLEIRGSGVVVGQSPEPGADLSRAGSCTLVLAAP